MCRFAAYLGPSILISTLVTKPKHSIIHQSYQAEEREEPLNGDGFGLSWYAPQFCKEPAIFKEVSPAWSNPNLEDIARVTKSHCIFAHVRAATVGGGISRANCHPFSWREFTFMHNGTVYGFQKIKRNLCHKLSEEAYNLLQGSTDSEHIFALFADHIKEIKDPKTKDLSNALLKTIASLEELKKQAGVSTPSSLNLVVSDGSSIVGTRYISHGEESNSLYYTHGKNFSCTTKGVCHIEHGQGAFLLASEPLTKEQVWHRVNNNHIISVGPEKEILVEPIVLKE